jgi:hypothetical protein
VGGTSGADRLGCTLEARETPTQTTASPSARSPGRLPTARRRLTRSWAGLGECVCAQLRTCAVASWPSMVNVLPVPVGPYAMMVALYPSSVDITALFAEC